ncbi:MAG: tail fiber domain-containing protein [Candidatus Eisenbacteria bacterium]
MFCINTMRVSLVVAALTILVWTGIAAADVPRKFNYQGRLTDSATGDPLVGPQDVTFRVYDHASDGSLLWSEEQTLLPDPTGVIATILGSVDSIDVEFNGPVWLEVEVAGEILMPRREIVSVPFALRAGSADEADSADYATSADTALSAAHALSADTATSAAHAETSDHATSSDSLAGYAAGDFAAAMHLHDERYYTQDSLSVAGTLNDTANPVDWSKLKGVPAGFADGTDDGGGGIGDGHSLDAVDGNPTDALYVDVRGDVGIGTTDASTKLHVYEDTDGQIGITIENPNTGSLSAERISFNDENGGVAAILTYDPEHPSFPNGMRMFNNRPGGGIGFRINGSSDLVRLKGDNVGIGTTTPAERLDVAGTTRMTGFKMPTGAANGYVLKSDATGTGTWQPAAVGDGHSLDAADGSPVDALYVANNGHVGIGTASPQEILHLDGGSSREGFVRFTHDNVGATVNDGFTVGIDEDGDARLWNHETRYLSLATGDTERIRITGDGDVGIGTYAPANELHLHKSAAENSYFTITNEVTGTTSNDGLLLGVDFGGRAYVINKEGTALNFGAANHVYQTITNDGKVGIGTSTPAYQFHVHEPVGGFCYGLITSEPTGDTFDDGLKFGVNSPVDAFIVNQEDGPLQLGAGGFYRLTIASDGKVGIGTNTPEHNLQVHQIGGSQCYAQFTNGPTGYGENDGLTVGLDQSGNGLIWQHENAPLFIGTNNTNAMSIKSNGNVGLGFLLPEVKLAVEGVVRVEGDAWPVAGEGMELAYNSVADRGYIQVYDRNLSSWGELYLGNGNVGIGKLDPATLLHLRGEDPYITVSTTANEAGIRLAKNDATEWEWGWNEGSGYTYFWGSGGAGTSLVIEDATGEVGIGTSTPSFPLDVAGAAHASSHPTSSDERFKRDVRQLSGVLDRLQRIRGVSFEWNALYESLGRASGHREIGVIAQEVEAEFPELVTTWGEEDYRAVEYGRMTGVLIEAIKELRAENEALRQRVEALEGAMN